MTKIDSMTHTIHEGTTIYMDDGTELTDRDIAPLAEALRQNGGVRDASVYIEAAWATAHPIPEGTKIPADVPVIARDQEGVSYNYDGLGVSLKVGANSDVEYRTLEPLPEPAWANARYVWADSGNTRTIYERSKTFDGRTYWHPTGSDAPYTREEMAQLKPVPVKEEDE